MGKRRIISIITCLALFGFTLTPAAYYPCCCSTECKGHQKIATSSCCAPSETQASCCTAKGSQWGCPVKKALNRTPPDCRCLKQLTKLSIPSTNSYHNPSRVALEGLTFLASPAAMPPTRSETSSFSPNLHPLMLVLLRTCTLLC